jgi:hypothetical protein
MQSKQVPRPLNLDPLHSIGHPEFQGAPTQALLWVSLLSLNTFIVILFP